MVGMVSETVEAGKTLQGPASENGLIIAVLARVLGLNSTLQSTSLRLSVPSVVWYNVSGYSRIHLALTCGNPVYREDELLWTTVTVTNWVDVGHK